MNFHNESCWVGSELGREEAAGGLVKVATCYAAHEMDAQF